MTTNDSAQALLAAIIDDPQTPPPIAAKCRGLLDALRDQGLDSMREALVLAAGMMGELQEQRDQLARRALVLGEVEALSHVADLLRSIAANGIDHVKERLPWSIRMLDRIFEKNRPRL